MVLSRENFCFIKKNRIGVVSCENNNNIGNNLVKFAMYNKLKELKLDPVIIALTRYENIYFIKKHLKLKEIKNSFEELKESNFDYLMVNSDQTWVNITPNFLPDIGFLKFAINWNIPKFIYGASYPLDEWRYSEKLSKNLGLLLKKINGISVRELSTIILAKKYFNVTPEFVLDPTLLIDKKYYLNLIKNYNGDFNSSQNYLCVYQLDNNTKIKKFIQSSSLQLKLTIHRVNINKANYIEDFIKCIYTSKAVITDSYHGTIFSIIFEKPFISFINNYRGNTRFKTIRYIFNAYNRIISTKSSIKNKMKLLTKKFIINKKVFEHFKNKSLLFLKKNLLIKNKTICEHI